MILFISFIDVEHRKTPPAPSKIVVDIFRECYEAQKKEEAAQLGSKEEAINNTIINSYLCIYTPCPIPSCLMQ